MLHDKAQPVRNTGDKFAAFVTYFEDCALVQVYPRPSKYAIDFNQEVACYETSRKGAAASARREVRRLECGH